ncbi:hypothetical protein ACR6C2_30605 [Streptomyces sp. INA 01156]
MVALVFGIVKGETWGWTSAGTLGAIVLGLALLVVFGWYETRQEHPLLPMRLFRNRSLTTGAVMTLLNFFVMLGGIFFIMLYLQNVRATRRSRPVSAPCRCRSRRCSPRRSAPS